MRLPFTQIPLSYADAVIGPRRDIDILAPALKFPPPGFASNIRIVGLPAAKPPHLAIVVTQLITIEKVWQLRVAFVVAVVLGRRCGRSRVRG